MTDFSLLELQAAQEERRLVSEMRTIRLPEHWEGEREDRIAKATEKSVEAFIYFCKTYFPDDWFTFDFTDDQKQEIRDALSNDNKIHIYAKPRRHGKTRRFRVFKVWCAVAGVKHHYSKVSDTLDLAEKDFRHVRAILKYNIKITSDFGSLIDPAWDSLHSFRVVPHQYNPKGTLFVANSYTVTLRGELGDTRPDFVEFDEFEDYSTSINPDISRDKIDVIERDFHPALAENSCGVYLGNNARTTCIINILAEMDEAERKAKHPAFTLTIIPAWDEKTQRPTWHQQYEYKSEEEMRIGVGASMSVWKAEWQQVPSPPEGVRFLLEHYITYDKLPTDARGIVMCDPAFGETSDFKAAVMLMYSEKVKRFYVPEVFVRRTGWKQYFEWMHDVYARWGRRLYWIGWESNFAQAQYLEFMQLYPTTKDKPPLPIRKIEVEGDKFFRIEQLETPYSLGNIMFSRDLLRTQDGIEAQSQLIGYIGKKNAKHRVDFPDCLSTAYTQMFIVAATLSSGGTKMKTGGLRNTAESFYGSR